MPAAREGQAASRSGSGLGRAADGGVEVGVGGGVRDGVESGVGCGVEGVRRARGNRRATAAADGRRRRREWRELDLGEVAVGKDEPRG